MADIFEFACELSGVSGRPSPWEPCECNSVRVCHNQREKVSEIARRVAPYRHGRLKGQSLAMRPLVRMIVLTWAGLANPGTAVTETARTSSGKPERGSFGIIVENDTFGNGSDRNYSNGVQVNFRGAFEEAPEIVQRLGNSVAALGDVEPQSFGLSFGHLLFTPEDIDAVVAPPDQHPYAGFLFGQASFVAERQNEIRSIDVTLGLVGPSAGGEWVQRNFHDLINAKDPKGWDSQLHDELAFAIDVDRRWRVELADPSGPISADLSPNLGLAVGTLRDELKAGLTLRVGSGLENDFGPPRIRPSLSGAGLARAEPGVRAYAFIGFYGRAVARNLFLDGNTFRDSARVDSEPFVGDIQAGINLQIGATAIAYTYVARSPEYETQQDSQQFGAITISRRW